MEAIMKRLGEMNQLLMVLSDNATAVNRRFDRLDDTLADVNRRIDRMDVTLHDTVREIRRNSDRLNSVELRLGELGVRISALEPA